MSRIDVPLLRDGRHTGYEVILGCLRTDMSTAEITACTATLRDLAGRLVPLLS